MSPEYRVETIPGYAGNPLIEALPQIFSDEQAGRALRRLPEYAPEMRNLPVHERLHLIDASFEVLFEPLPIHLQLERKVSRIIRLGYLPRNPVRAGHWRMIGEAAEAIRLPSDEDAGPLHGPAGSTLLGDTGMGKTTSFKRILGTYPRVVVHNDYRGTDLSGLVQLTHLWLECPQDGSVKGLCEDFFHKVDAVLGTRYYDNCVRGKRGTVDKMVPQIARIAGLHSIGLLAIDEIQNLSLAKSGGAQQALAFFVQLVNAVGMPVMLVGSPAVFGLLSSDFRQARRNTGRGDVMWSRMLEDDPEWTYFLEGIWRYQFTRQECELTTELSSALHLGSQGIIEFAVNLWSAAQRRAIESATAPEEEVVTLSTILSAADEMSLTAPGLMALRNNDREAIRAHGNLFLEAFGAAGPRNYAQLARAVGLDGAGAAPSNITDAARRRRKQPARAAQPNVPAPAKVVGGERAKSEARAERSPARTKSGGAKAKTTTGGAPAGTLPAVVSAGGASAYEALSEAGHLRPATEFVPREGDAA